MQVQRASHSPHEKAECTIVLSNLCPPVHMEMCSVVLNSKPSGLFATDLTPCVSVRRRSAQQLCALRFVEELQFCVEFCEFTHCFSEYIIYQNENIVTLHSKSFIKYKYIKAKLTSEFEEYC